MDDCSILDTIFVEDNSQKAAGYNEFCEVIKNEIAIELKELSKPKILT